MCELATRCKIIRINAYRKNGWVLAYNADCYKQMYATGNGYVSYQAGISIL